MATLVLIKEAIGSLKERTGSSLFAINKYIETEKKVRVILLLSISSFGCSGNEKVEMDKPNQFVACSIIHFRPSS
jgi:linker histone H1 and H5 family